MLTQAIQDALFGDQFPQTVVSKKSDDDIPLTAAEVEALIDPLIEDTPAVLIEHMGRCLGRFKQIQALNDSAMVSPEFFELTRSVSSNDAKISAKRAKKESLKEFRENLCWVFGLYATPSVMDFDIACAYAGQDPEWIRDGISKTFGDDIRTFYKQVKAIFPDCGERMRKMLKGYVSLQEC